ncbi:MAG TPA: ABC transporter ATP-binding protein, partial [Lachnospiraceae bacterium]|nr:ABC transporter ATP-binding protein [Lachnospiraceae bacterium]
YFFAAVLLPRVLAVPLSTWSLIGRDEASRTLACFRAVHMPEKLIMICSVVFRFFPVLSGDMKLMRQSVKTRGVYSTLGQKLRALPEYLEILTVPMALRVIRIAETLSASAETRGIALGGKRSSYVRLSFCFWDFIFIFLLAAVLVIGFIR